VRTVDGDGGVDVDAREAHTHGGAVGGHGGVEHEPIRAERRPHLQRRRRQQLQRAQPSLLGGRLAHDGERHDVASAVGRRHRECEATLALRQQVRGAVATAKATMGVQRRGGVRADSSSINLCAASE